MDVSLVICTYNRASILVHALDSLTKQTAETSRYEIIVVDNNSTDETRSLVERFAGHQANIRYVLEPRGGLSFARDAGFRAAASEWIVYLDDDIKAQSDLVERAIHVIEHYDFDCFGGLCRPWFEHKRPRWLHDRYVENEVGADVTTGVLEQDFAKGALIAFRKSILEELGGFTTPHGRSLGMTHGQLAYGEETRLQVEMRRRGYTIGFDRLLVVDHLVHPERLQAGFFLRMRFAKGRDHWDTFDADPTVVELAKCMALAIIKPIGRLPGALLRLLGQREYYLQNAVLDTIYPAATSLGQMYGGLRIRRMRNQPAAS